MTFNIHIKASIFNQKLNTMLPLPLLLWLDIMNNNCPFQPNEKQKNNNKQLTTKFQKKTLLTQFRNFFL
jgi:hypothetical protein